jgi:MoxR-like ATPase
MVAVSSLRDRVVKEVGNVVVSKERETELLLISLLARGHTLIEGVPGVSKTLLAKSFSDCMGLGFRRVQFTPDMLPLDIVGGFIFNMKDREFEFRKGPIFTNILLADEINRSPPKVQSALLESMQERQVTIEGHTEALPSPHMVIATQNSVEFQGVYPLPEAQLDRFMLRIGMGYPSVADEGAIIKRNMTGMGPEMIQKVVSPEELDRAFQEVMTVKVSDELVDYMARFAAETRNDERVELGASPRAMVHLTHAARAKAYVSGRSYVIPDDIKELALHVIPHRLKLSHRSVLLEGTVTAEGVTRQIIDRVKPPR